MRFYFGLYRGCIQRRSSGYICLRVRAFHRQILVSHERIEQRGLGALRTLRPQMEDIRFANGHA